MNCELIKEFLLRNGNVAISYNGRCVAEVVDLKAPMFILARMFIRITDAQFSTNATILATHCWWLVPL